MSVTDYLRIFRRFWLLVVVFTIVGAVIGYASWFVNWWIIDYTPEYESTATLFVATQTGTTTAEAYQNDLFSQQRTLSYAALASSEQVAVRAVEQLKAPISPDELRTKITAKPVIKTVMLEITVSDPSPAQAQAYAAAVADQVVGLVGELETSRRGGTPSAAAVIVDDASYPTKPAGLSLLKRIALGAAGGLVIGLLAALLAGVSDKRLRGRDNIESVTGSLVKGGLPKDPMRQKAEAVDLESNSLYAERIRELRTNLRFTVLPDNSGPPRCIAVTSPGAGDGRTTTAIDLAAALAESGRSVLLVDGDLRQSTLVDRVSSDDAVREAAALHGLSTVLNGEDDLRDVIKDVRVGGHVISLLAAGPPAPRPGELWATDRAAKVLEHLSKTFDYVIIDTPPLDTYTDGAVVGALADGAILLARIGGTTARSLRRAVETLTAANVTLLGTVVTFEPVGRLMARTHAKQRNRNVSDDRTADQADGSGGTGSSSDRGESNGSAADLPSVRAGAHGKLLKSGLPDEGK